MILVTGGAGFIGSNFVLDLRAGPDEPVVTLDALTYAGDLVDVQSLAGDPRHTFVRGDGRQIRVWLYVGDHCTGIRRVLKAGRPGEVYCIGGSSEMANIDVVNTLGRVLDKELPRADGTSYARRIKFVTDRPGHDRRYPIDHNPTDAALGWQSADSFDFGMRKTVRWYLDHGDWVADVTSGHCRRWIDQQYEALGRSAVT